MLGEFERTSRPVRIRTSKVTKDDGQSALQDDDVGFARCALTGFDDEEGALSDKLRLVASVSGSRSYNKPLSPHISFSDLEKVCNEHNGEVHPGTPPPSPPQRPSLDAMLSDKQTPGHEPSDKWSLKSVGAAAMSATETPSSPSSKHKEMQESVPLDSLALVGWALAQVKARRELRQLVEERGSVPYHFTQGPLGLRLNLDSTEGVVEAAHIESVVEGGAAYALGVPVGAKLVRINDVPIAGVQETSVKGLALQRPITFFLIAPPKS